MRIATEDEAPNIVPCNHVKGVPVPSVALNRASYLQAGQVSSLQFEIHQAHESLQTCFLEMEQILARPNLDAGALTSVRLKLAGLRLTRGPLIIRVAQALAGKIMPDEAAMLEELRCSHQRLLQKATAHTSKWTLEAIAADWPQYRAETRELMRQWLTKAEQEQRLVCPLVQRCAASA
ncbi:MAG: hypothetical protein QOF34_911 [Sphingomonadales bacterium]|nr:hypothetical protein [Sphingomonadales bacterium]